VELDAYQAAAAATDRRPGASDESLLFPLVGLASEVGGLFSQFKRRVRDGDANELAPGPTGQAVGDVLWYAANLATKLGLSLNDLAERNLARVNERWPAAGSEHPARLLDDDFPEQERLPRDLAVVFTEDRSGDRPAVRIAADGRDLGDPLHDMAWKEDGFRYHDALHLTNVAVLGWSPIARAYLGRQRRSQPGLRHVEDSGRAKIIEEAVVALAFEYARDERFLEGARSVDSSLLRTITAMTSRLEVRVRTAAEWEAAILRGFEMWRLLREHAGGSLVVDMHQRSVRFVPAGSISDQGAGSLS
jgi:NTP pyrophosphatase (non-canonical NTP hydrolase)